MRPPMRTVGMRAGLLESAERYDKSPYAQRLRGVIDGEIMFDLNISKSQFQCRYVHAREIRGYGRFLGD